MTKHRILIVLTPAFNRNKGGVQRITYNLGVYFEENGLDVGYFSFATNGHVTPTSGQLFHAHYNGGCAKVENGMALHESIKDFKPSIVINQMPYERSLRVTLQSAKLEYNFKLIACIHNSLFAFTSNIRDILRRKAPFPFLQPFFSSLFVTFISKLWHNKKHGRALKSIVDVHDKVLLYTPPNFEEFIYFVGNYKPQKIGYMPNPFSGIARKFREREKVILHVGRINIAQKRSDLLLEFWEYCYRMMDDWRFVIIGDGPYFEILAAELERRNLPRVELLGFRDPNSYYQIASFFMMPSAFEGFPNTILEAHSHGLPVLAFDSYKALSWIVNDGEDALLTKPFDVKLLAHQAIKLTNDSEGLQSMQVKARKNSKRFTIDKVGKQWLQLFDELIHGS